MNESLEEIFSNIQEKNDEFRSDLKPEDVEFSNTIRNRYSPDELLKIARKIIEQNAGEIQKNRALRSNDDWFVSYCDTKIRWQIVGSDAKKRCMATIDSNSS